MALSSVRTAIQGIAHCSCIMASGIMPWQIWWQQVHGGTWSRSTYDTPSSIVLAA